MLTGTAPPNQYHRPLLRDDCSHTPSKERNKPIQRDGRQECSRVQHEQTIHIDSVYQTLGHNHHRMNAITPYIRARQPEMKHHEWPDARRTQGVQGNTHKYHRQLFPDPSSHSPPNARKEPIHTCTISGDEAPRLTRRQERSRVQHHLVSTTDSAHTTLVHTLQPKDARKQYKRSRRPEVNHHE